MYRRLDGSHIVGDPARARAAVGREGRRVLIVSDRRIVLLLDVFDQAFDHRAWHGTPLWGALRGLSHREALWRPRRGRHNIWEIVLHTAYWKYIVRRRLARDVALAFPRAGSNWPPLPAPADARAWKRDVALLKEQHRLLRQAIARLPSSGPGRGARPGPTPPTSSASRRTTCITPDRFSSSSDCSAAREVLHSPLSRSISRRSFL